MKISSVKKSEIDKTDLRVDASYHLSDGRLHHAIVTRNPFKNLPLKGVTERIFSGNIFKRLYVADAQVGYHYLTASDMAKSDIETGKYISKKYTSQYKNLKIEKDWILLSCSGTLGNTAYTNADYEKFVGTHDLIRIIPAKDKIYSGYLYAFLSCKYGYSLLTQFGFGGVVKHIEPHHIENIPIPILPEATQQKIHNLITEASQLRVEANKLLKESVEVFETEIGHSKVNHSYQYGKITSDKIYGFHKRFDSQYHLGWNSLDNEMKKDLAYVRISDVASNIFVGGRGKRNYVENGVPFLSSSDMMLFNPKRNCKKISTSTQGIELMKVNLNDILISRSGTVGNTVIVGEDLEGTAISEHALRLVIDDQKISPFYVFTFLKTKFGMKTMESSSFGSVIITLNEDLIGNIKLPLLKADLQNKIFDLTKRYLANYDLATTFENQAIDLIEKEIDQWQQL